MITFGQFIKQKRIAAKLTQAQVAAHLGYTSYTMISELENGNKFWHIRHAVKLAELFNIRLSELFREWENITVIIDDTKDVLDRVLVS